MIYSPISSLWHYILNPILLTNNILIRIPILVYDILAHIPVLVYGTLTHILYLYMIYPAIHAPARRAKIKTATIKVILPAPLPAYKQ